jgi:hypothetical protein
MHIPAGRHGGIAKTARPLCWDLTACLGSRSCAAERQHGPQSSADVSAQLLNRGIADTLEEAKAALASRCQQVKRGNDGGSGDLLFVGKRGMIPRRMT